MYGKLLLFGVVSLVSSVGGVTAFRNAPVWVTVPSSELLTVGVEPAGKEGDVTLYVIRCFHNGRMIPGKLYIRNREIWPNVPNEGGEHTCSEFQVLVDPTRSTEWLDPEDIGNNAPVEGGQMSDWDTAYVCRAKHNDLNIIPGKFSVKTGECHYGIGGKERKTTEAQVLATIQKSDLDPAHVRMS